VKSLEGEQRVAIIDEVRDGFDENNRRMSCSAPGFRCWLFGNSLGNWRRPVARSTGDASRPHFLNRLPEAERAPPATANTGAIAGASPLQVE
jgi:hypothetical protein